MRRTVCDAQRFHGSARLPSPVWLVLERLLERNLSRLHPDAHLGRNRPHQLRARGWRWLWLGLETIPNGQPRVFGPAVFADGGSEARTRELLWAQMRVHWPAIEPPLQVVVGHQHRIGHSASVSDGVERLQVLL